LGPTGLNRGCGDQLGTDWSSLPLVCFRNLRSPHQRRLLISEINLIVQTVRLIDDRLDYGIYDSTAVHGDADAVTDRVLPWRRVGVFRHGGIVCYFQPEAKMVFPDQADAEKSVCGSRAGATRTG
jgi:hypothetical protein